MLGTIRTLDYKMKDHINKRMKEMVADIAKAYGGEATCEIKDATDITFNIPELAQQMLPTLKRVAGDKNVIAQKAITGAEDFSYFQRDVPGFFLFLGGMTPGKTASYRHHTPDFLIDDAGMQVAPGNSATSKRLYRYVAIAFVVRKSQLLREKAHSLETIHGDVEASAIQLLQLAGVLLIGTLPFCAFGLFLAYLCGPNSAPAVVNVIYLPMAFASGLWIPIQMLPEWLQSFARFLPAYHLGQLGLRPFDAHAGDPLGLHIVYLVAFTSVFCFLASVLMKRDQGKTYG